MRISPSSCRMMFLACLAIVSIPPAVNAAALKITVTSLQPAGGFAFSPVWLGFHDGSFQTFTAGTSASSSIEAIAELADAGPISSAFAGHGVQKVVGGSPFAPGSSASAIVNISDPVTDRMVNFAAMVVPSNDLFMGNQNSIALFDTGGNFLGPKTITIFGKNVWDAGTEVNNITDHPAFIQGLDAHGGTDENGTVGLFLDRLDAASYLSTILGKTTAANYEISNLLSADGAIASITFQSVPEASSVAMLAISFALVIGVWSIKRLRRQIAA